MILALSGCATAPLPYCEEWTAYAGVHPDIGPVLLLDSDNALILRNMIKGLEARTCRIKRVGA